MKLPKSLLGAMLLGITVQMTETSCNKKEKEIKTQPASGQAPANETGNDPNKHPDNCPACGMG